MALTWFKSLGDGLITTTAPRQSPAVPSYSHPAVWFWWGRRTVPPGDAVSEGLPSSNAGEGGVRAAALPLLLRPGTLPGMARRSCPACKTPLIRIVFGFPGYELFEAQERGEIMLGGCCIPPYMPQGWCPTCQAERGFTCPICGYGRLLDPPWADWGRPSAAPCPCCGTRFGVDASEPGDEEAHLELRRRWVEAGCRWWSTEQKPPQRWDPAVQLRAVEDR
jgi:hypothetical protein